MSQIMEVSSIESGGRIAGYNDAHYGMPWVILTSGRGKNMGDGWETRRRREPGHDWILGRLGATAVIEKVEVDAAHFKGNYSDRCSLQASMKGLKPMKNWLPRQKNSRNFSLHKNFRWISNIFFKNSSCRIWGRSTVSA